MDARKRQLLARSHAGWERRRGSIGTDLWRGELVPRHGRRDQALAWLSCWTSVPLGSMCMFQCVSTWSRASFSQPWLERLLSSWRLPLLDLCVLVTVEVRMHVQPMFRRRMDQPCDRVNLLQQAVLHA